MYCNSHLHGLPDTPIIPLLRLQNIAARIEHITPEIYKLPWLLVRMRILLKLLMVVYKCVQKLAPAYLCDIVHPKHKSKYGFRDDLLDLHVLHIPQSKNVMYGDQAFSVNGPTEWNWIPFDNKDDESVAILKTRLKTYLFKSTLDECLRECVHECVNTCVCVCKWVFCIYGLFQFTLISMNNFTYFSSFTIY